MLELIRKRVRKFAFRYPAAEAIRKKQVPLPAGGREILECSLRQHFYSDPECYPDPPSVYLKTVTGKADLDDHVDGKVNAVRELVVPWLTDVVGLEGKRILDVGCGCGTSALPLAEQGALVTGLDVKPGNVQVARDRFQLYGLPGTFIHENGSELRKIAHSQKFDVILFYAVLEHMTWEERKNALQTAWESLDPGSYLVVTETPNRLWHYDGHTSNLPFFLWLPDEIAFEYSNRSGRAFFNSMHTGTYEQQRIIFHRWGRGVSFHDFALGFGMPAEELPVRSSLTLSALQRRHCSRLYDRTEAGRYYRMLSKLAPSIHPGFLASFSLDLIFQKGYRAA